MTIPMSTSNIRADFMISDAAIPQQLEIADKADRFKDMLSGLGTADTGLTLDKETVVDFDNMNDLDLARAVIRGDADIKDIPAERITPQFLVALTVAKRLEKQEDPDKDDEEEFENIGEKFKCAVFNPVEAALVQQQLMQLADDALTREIYEILALLSDEDEDKVTLLDGVSGIFPEESSDITSSVELTDEGFDIIDRLVETVSEGQQEAMAEELAPDGQEVGEIPEIGRLDPGELFVAENSGEAAEQLSGENANALEDAVKNGEIEQPRVILSIDRSQVKTAVDDAVKAKSNVQSADDRSKQLAEELEMLRNAKAAKSESRLFDLDDLEDSDESKPVQTANPLMADSPVTFTRDDGSEISVRPAEVVKQAAELVTKAVSENKENVEYSVVLNPEDLGKITVKLTKSADGAVSVTIAAENAHTQRILEQNSELMQSNLRQNGVNLESWQTVSESQQETLAQDYNGSSKNPYYRRDESDAEDDNNDRSFADIIAAM